MKSGFGPCYPRPYLGANCFNLPLGTPLPLPLKLQLKPSTSFHSPIIFSSNRSKPSRVTPGGGGTKLASLLYKRSRSAPSERRKRYHNVSVSRGRAWSNTDVSAALRTAASLSKSTFDSASRNAGEASLK